jgi:hypothetical protein
MYSFFIAQLIRNLLLRKLKKAVRIIKCGGNQEIVEGCLKVTFVPNIAFLKHQP